MPLIDFGVHGSDIHGSGEAHGSDDVHRLRGSGDTQGSDDVHAPAFMALVY
ncbi:hypothetical protein BJ508DRAFT_323046 [Ascobolus immersus RN42]|uniref:Uncharacterized protein n=1 Tax=Ascobolus immersus RN42 TaxID=1160509 RepID=A0A3N4IHX6_ASCIM|nr:hypothetical protein BJ508DRAFT_323046 [Ascobolus immersus RN42]